MMLLDLQEVLLCPGEVYGFPLPTANDIDCNSQFLLAKDSHAHDFYDFFRRELASQYGKEMEASILTADWGRFSGLHEHRHFRVVD